MEDPSFVEFLLDQLRGLGQVTHRPMFGGYGLYHEAVFFGIVFEGRFYLKTDESSRRRYMEQGMGPFQPNPKQTLKSYYEVPVDVLEDDRMLVDWAKEAVRCQQDGRRSGHKGKRTE